ncbi:hypothetical protein Fcan01_22201 [Folsomia candida]|uniref:Uncharacterized protein n=1 Tax=Folsomia candida TaxID=158441 RepID=A0A226DDN1_FOLCA|nr:hypothetical protein Fcan01_22201 [Folsomia candida]
MLIEILLACLVQYIVSFVALIIVGIGFVNLCYLLVSIQRLDYNRDEELGKLPPGRDSFKKLLNFGVTLGVILLNGYILCEIIFSREMAETDFMTTIWLGLVDLAVSLGACAIQL